MAVTLQSILQASFAADVAAQQVPRRVWRAARALMACRTAALGGHGRQCPAGHVTEVWYNSCRHRACPWCCTQRSSQWLDNWQQQVLPTAHLHVIFTLPSELHELWRWNRDRMTEVLFSCVRETLLTLLGDPQWVGATPGILATLHAWGRTLALHPHVHCLVSGGGLTVDGRWQAIANGLDCCVLAKQEERSHGWHLLLFGKDFGEDFRCGLTPLQEVVRVHDQLLDQRLALLPTRLPNSLDGVRRGSPFFR